MQIKEGLVRVQKTPMGYHIHDELDEYSNLYDMVEDGNPMMHYFLGMEVWQSTDGIFL